MQKEELTEKQKELYSVIKQFIKEKGYSPTVRELCNITGTNSTSVVANKLYRMKDKGYIDFVANSPRTIRITKKLRS